MGTRWAWIALAILVTLTSALACGGGDDTSGGGGTVPTIAITPGGTMASEGVQDKMYFGTLISPNEGPVVLFVHHDNTLDLLVVDTQDITYSSWMTGTLEGQRVIVEDALGLAKGSGRPEGPGFEINMTYPGLGFTRSEMTETTEVGLYKGELNGFPAGLVITADGTIYGFAVIEGGDEPAFEYLCVDGDVEDMPDEVTATTCDSGEEVTLTKMVD